MENYESVHSGLKLLSDTLDNIVKNHIQYTKEQLLSHFVFVPFKIRSIGTQIIFDGQWYFDSKNLPTYIKDEIENSLHEVIKSTVFIFS